MLKHANHKTFGTIGVSMTKTLFGHWGRSKVAMFMCLYASCLFLFLGSFTVCTKPLSTFVCMAQENRVAETCWCVLAVSPVKRVVSRLLFSLV